MLSAKDCDAIIIGAGHNGLVCAFYLARAGLKVRMFERRHIVGGAAVTEEFLPGFRNSTASYTVSLLSPKVISDMRLADRGLRVVRRPIANFLPQPDGRALKIGPDLARTRTEVSRFSARDAEALGPYYAMLEAVADVLRDLALRTPPNAGGGLKDLMAAAAEGRRIATLPIERQRDLVDLFAKSARAFLDGWFEDEAVKGAFGFDSIVGAYASPETPGSAYVLLHHAFGEADGVKGAWGHAIGGMGAITSAMREACEQGGVVVETEAPIARVLVDGERAVGVALEDGREAFAPAVVANVGPKILYQRLLAASDLTPEFQRRVAGFKVGSGVFRMNVALAELPDFTCLPGKVAAEHHMSGILIAPTLAYMDAAHHDARRFGWSRAPIVEMLIPSTVDDSLAPPGAHVASLFCQQFAPELPDGRSWDDEREAAADLIIDTVDAYAPNFKAAVLGRQLLSPLDLERTFGLAGGDIMHGQMTLDQLWSARPILGFGAYRGPLRGLYMCGAGTHPGGGVTGAPGHNAAREILADLGLARRVAARLTAALER